MNGPHSASSQCQSRWIALWANIDIYYAMNYMLSSFCTQFDEFAVAVLLKQLSEEKEVAHWILISSIWKMFSENNDMQIEGIKVSREFQQLSNRIVSID